MHYSTRIQILQSKEIADHNARVAAMAQTANKMKIEGEFPHVADAMTEFLRSCLPVKSGIHPSRTLSAAS